MYYILQEDSDLGFYRNNLYRSSMQGNTTMPTVRKRFDDRTSSPGMKSGYLFETVTN